MPPKKKSRKGGEQEKKEAGPSPEPETPPTPTKKKEKKKKKEVTSASASDDGPPPPPPPPPPSPKAGKGRRGKSSTKSKSAAPAPTPTPAASSSSANHEEEPDEETEDSQPDKEEVPVVREEPDPYGNTDVYEAPDHASKSADIETKATQAARERLLDLTEEQQDDLATFVFNTPILYDREQTGWRVTEKRLAAVAPWARRNNKDRRHFGHWRH